MERLASSPANRPKSSIPSGQTPCCSALSTSLHFGFRPVDHIQQPVREFVFRHLPEHHPAEPFVDCILRLHPNGSGIVKTGKGLLTRVVHIRGVGHVVPMVYITAVG